MQQFAAAVLSLATVDEVQRHNRDAKADEGSACAKQTLCSRKSRDEDVLGHSNQLIAVPLEPTSRTRSNSELTSACPTPADQVSSAPRKGTKTRQKLQTRSD